MPEEILRVPIEFKDCRFARAGETEGFVRFMLNTVPGSYEPDPDFGCRSPYFAPEYCNSLDDLKNDIRNRLLDQFERYLNVTVHVEISERVEPITAFFTCRISGRMPSGERLSLKWEI
jgi:hypothetical protein